MSGGKTLWLAIFLSCQEDRQCHPGKKKCTLLDENFPLMC